MKTHVLKITHNYLTDRHGYSKYLRVNGEKFEKKGTRSISSHEENSTISHSQKSLPLTVMSIRTLNFLTFTISFTDCR